MVVETNKQDRADYSAGGDLWSLGDGGGEGFGELETGFGAVETYDHKDAVSKWETIKVPDVEAWFLQYS